MCAVAISLTARLFRPLSVQCLNFPRTKRREEPRPKLGPFWLFDGKSLFQGGLCQPPLYDLDEPCQNDENDAQRKYNEASSIEIPQQTQPAQDEKRFLRDIEMGQEIPHKTCLKDDEAYDTGDEACNDKNRSRGLPHQQGEKGDHERQHKTAYADLHRLD